MKYKVNKEQWYAILTVEDSIINDHLASALCSVIESLHADGTENMILNLQKVKHVDSSALGVILTGGELWKGKGLYILCEVNHPEIRKKVGSIDLEDPVRSEERRVGKEARELRRQQ